MIICSRQETTIDYLGKFGQILFVSGCNFRCGFCHNPELVEKKSNSIDLDLLLKDLESKAKSGWYNGVVISGGEPTLYPDLIDFVKKLKSLGLDVKIDTNGSNPSAIEKLIEVVDFISMDVKAPKEKYAEIVNVPLDIDKISKSIELLRYFNSEFRTTVLPFLSKDDFRKIGEWISDGGKFKVKRYTLQQFNPQKTLDASFGELILKSRDEIMEIAELMKDYAEEVRVKGV